MKIAILHQDLEQSEKEFQKALSERGAKTDLHDVRDVSLEELLDYDLVLNRVYASVANRNYKDNLKTLNVLQQLEVRGTKCLNSYLTTLADYSKFFSSKMMEREGVKIPATIKIENLDQIQKGKEFAERCDYPLVIKRDMGGRGKDVVKVSNEKEFIEKLNYFFNPEYVKNYNAGIIVQEFIKPVKNYDCRIGIIDGQYVNAFSRSLISCNGEEPWIASVANGSKTKDYQPSEEEINLAVRATNAIGALFNYVDMAFSKDGMVIIENNPTPNFVHASTKRIEKTAELIVDKYRRPMYRPIKRPVIQPYMTQTPSIKVA